MPFWEEAELNEGFRHKNVADPVGFDTDRYQNLLLIPD
jgi:hypothetical protein